MKIRTTLMFSLLTGVLHAQPGSLDPTLDPGTGLNAEVQAVAVQPDGRILIAGNFTNYFGTGKNRVARLLANGTLDTSFDPGTGTNFAVESIVLQPDGKILIAGAFTTVNEVPRTRIARLNADGSLDASFNPGQGPNGQIFELALQPDGKILVGGQFGVWNGAQRGRLVRLNSNGTFDASFNTGTGANDRVRAINVQPDGKVVVGGEFTTFNGTTSVRITRLNSDGSNDTTFNLPSGADNTVESVVLQADGSMIVGGRFLNLGGSPVGYLGRLNSDGSLDATFGSGAGPNQYIRQVLLDSEGRILICGNFTAFNSISRNRIARITADGALDEVFDPGTGANVLVYAMDLQSDEKIIIVGGFVNYDQVSRWRVARINTGCNANATENDVVSACDTYTWIDGNTYVTDNNSATQVVIQENGCPLTMVLDLSLQYSTSSSNTAEACDSYTWPLNGQNYTASGTYVTTAFNNVGCTQTDSLVLTILESTANTSQVVACGSHTWPVTGQTFSVSGTYIAAAVNGVGCTHTETLELTINNPSTSTEVHTACDSFTWIDGNTYTASNNSATYVLTNAAGCDSTVTLSLTVLNASVGTDPHSACDSFTWIDGNTYTASNNTATVVLTNAAGCDSIVTLDLNITTIDTTVTVTGITLTANAEGALYQWLDCNNGLSAIEEANEQSFTPGTNGSYAVEVTANGCTSTSACQLVVSTGVLENSFGTVLRIHPNPTNGSLEVALGKEYGSVVAVVRDMRGRIVAEQRIAHTSTLQLDIPGEVGLYTLQLHAGGSHAVVKVVKE